MSHGHEVVALQRQQGSWDPAHNCLAVDLLEGYDAIINLVGEPIASGWWSKAKMDRIFSSRVQATTLLAKGIQQLKNPPKVFLSASAVGYYGSRGDEILTEESISGNLFLSHVCREWETAASQTTNTRVIILRLGVVLDKDGGMLAKMLPLFRIGLGGYVGSGNTWISWIAIDDLLRLMQFLLFETTAQGIFNATSPEPVTSRDFAKTLAAMLHRPLLCRMPSWLVRFIFRHMADELLLPSVRAIPKNALEAGFCFQQSTMRSLLQSYF